MKKFGVAVILAILFMVFFGWTVGSFFHWLYWTMMVVASKLVFGMLYAIPVVIIILLVVALIYKRKS